MTTTVTQRPDTPIWTSGSTIIGTGNLATVLADDSDSNYAQTFSPFTKNRVRFESLAVPAGALIYSVVLRLRSRRPFADATIMAAGLNQRTGIPFTPGTATFTTSSSAPQPSFTPADLAFGVSLEWTSSGPENVDLSEAYLDVTYVEVPTVDVTAPTGTIAVTRPTVIWESDGDYPQSNYHVKIFSQAQYESPGFAPTTSSAFYDSGSQVGPTDQHIPTVNLTNGATYRVYVRTAQRVGSTTQWSAWDFEAITVSATPPSAPTLTAVADDTNARIKLTVTSADAWEFTTIERTSDGTLWEPVRSATRAPVFGDTFVLYDYETGNGDQVQYRALAITTVGDSDVASNWSTSTAPTSWTSTAIWLKAPLHPALNSVVVVQDIPSLTRRLPAGRYDVAARTDPIVVSDVRHLTEGTATFVTLTDETLAALLAVLDLGEVLLLQTPALAGWGSRYIAVGDTEEQRVTRDATEPTRLVVCPFVEVLAPVGEIVGFGITYDDVAALYADYDEVEAETTSYFDLMGVT